jgi:hypothetical protein
MNDGGVTPELKLRLKFCCSWNWFGFFCCYCWFVCFSCLFLFGWFCYGGFSIFISTPIIIFSILTTLQSGCAHPHSHPFTLPPSSVPKPIVLLPKNSLCPFSHILPCPHLLFTFSPNMSPDYPSLLCTHYLLTSIYTNFIQPQPPAVPDINNPQDNNRNKPKHTQGPQKPAAPMMLLPSTTPLPASPFSATLSNSPNFYS